MTKWCSLCSCPYKELYSEEKRLRQEREERLEHEGLHWQHQEQKQNQQQQPKQQADTHYEQTIVEIKRLASIYTENFLREGPFRELEEFREQFNWVYRILLLPDLLLRLLILKDGLNQSKINYRRLCILTHPDKNSHPLATNAFQKLVRVFEELN